jgi:mono/diheme cytochrome c family protein
MQHGRKAKRVVVFTVWALVAWSALVFERVESAGAPAFSPQGPGQQQTDPAQIEKGRQAVGQACAPCHGNIARMIQVQKKTADQWRDTIFSMIGRGAHVMPDEIEPLTAFLAANGGRQPAAPSQQAPAQPGTAAQDRQGALSQGRSLLEANCQQCHDLATATRKPATLDWATVVRNMVTYGARLTDADQQAIVAYLNTLP